MIFLLKYEPDFQRIISSIINDARNTIPAIEGQNGNAIYEYIQDQIEAIVPGVIVYRVITQNGNLGGYMALSVQNGGATVIQLQLRPAFVPFLSTISQIINTFIQENTFLQDILY